ncbi:hypothetical protein L218DRAFT_468445 [Marasmius fiardii PR-910]|nr:hypothetical protein L218DRAFT_468445 [Marasmius fiardii PR-910]
MNSTAPTPSATARPDLSSPFSSLPLRFVITLFHCLAIVFTIARLTRRVRIRRFSWDDAWAALCLILAIMFLALEWIKFDLVKKGPSVGLVNQLKTLYKLNIAVYTSIVWFSRVSLSLSIARIFPPGRTRLTAIFLSIACLVIGLVLVIGKPLACSISFPKPGQPAQLACIPGVWTFFYFQIIGDILSSVALVIFPIRALFPSTVSELRSSEHRLILVLLLSTLATLAMGLANAIFILKVDTFKMILFSDLEASVSLMVCNFLVVITSVWRVLSRWFSRAKSRDGDGEEGVDGGGGINNNYNTGEISLGATTTTTTTNFTSMTTTTATTTSGSQAITGSGSGSRPANMDNSTSRFSALTDIAELQTPPHSLPSMPSTELRSRLVTASSGIETTIDRSSSTPASSGQ